MERFNAWKTVLDREVVEGKGNMYIYNQLRLCDKHFEHYYKSPSKRLTRNAVPTLCINTNVTDISTEPKVDQIIEDQIIVDPIIVESPMSSALTETFFMSAPLVVEQEKVVVEQEKIVVQPRKDPAEECKRHLKVIESLKQRVLKLREKCKNQTKKLQMARKMSEVRPFMKIIERMPESLKTFMIMQLKCKQKERGRKYTLKEKIIAASILRQSQKTYNFLRKMIVLPSKRTIQRL